MLNAALGRTGLTDAAGQPLIFTPHDFRRMFITDAIMTGLPPHIAQVIAGHRDINVTMGYKAIYPDEVITHTRRSSPAAGRPGPPRNTAPRRRGMGRIPRPLRTPQALRRELRPGFRTPCIHEHACIRCPMLWPDPAQRPRLAEIRDNLIARITEAEREGWLGEIEGLQISLAGPNHKLAQIDRRSSGRQPVDLGFPVITAAAATLQKNTTPVSP